MQVKYLILAILVLQAFAQNQTEVTTIEPPAPTKPLRPIRFDSTCSSVQMYEKAYDGKCKLIDANVYSEMISLVNLIFESKSDMTLDELFRNKIFAGATMFFRETYADKSDYINSLDELTSGLNSVLESLKTSLSDATVLDVFTPFETSGFAKVAAEIEQVTDDLINHLTDSALNLTTEEESAIRFDYTCSNDQNFCSNTKNLLNITKFINEIADKTVKTFLEDLNSKAYKTLGNPINSPSKDLVDDFIENLDTQGTLKVTVADLSKILNLTYVQNVLYLYEVTSKRTTSLRPTRPVTTKFVRTTTPRNKVTDESAVDGLILVLIPCILLGMGFVSSLLLAGLSYHFRPVHTHFPVVPDGDKSLFQAYMKQQDVEMSAVQPQPSQ